MTDPELAQRVNAAVVDALQGALEVDRNEITPTATIMDDLGAESIDLLDLRFRIERALGLRITNEDLAEAFRATKSAEEFRRAFTVGAMCDYLVQRMAAADG